MSDQLSAYRRAETPLPHRYKLWPLYGTGFDKLGRAGEMIEVELPVPGRDELLVRHDACGICFSDIKVIRAGQNHPRIHRNMAEQPVVLGHEVALTVIAVGADLADRYRPGDRFIVQADIYINGKSFAYGYEIQGGFSQYGIVDQRVLNGDHGNYLLPVQAETGYAEAALNEPWACVVASYGVTYRTRWKEGGAVYLGGAGHGLLGAAESWRPASVTLDGVDAALAASVERWAAQHGVSVIHGDDGARPYADIIILGSDSARIERMFARLTNGGVFNIVSEELIPRSVQLDIGRLHYDRLALIGTNQPDLSAAYATIRAELKPGGVMWALGAAGPMGQMHVQRALEMPNGPGKVIATNIHRSRMAVLERKMQPIAQQHGVELVCISEADFPSASDMLHRLRAETGGRGFDDVVVIAANAATAEMAMPLMAEGGVMNVFAGLPRGTLSAFDVNLVTQTGVRFTGISGSSIEDLQQMLDLTESHRLATNHSVAAVAGLEGLPEGLKSVAEGRFPGKVVIYPHVVGLPLTPLEELAQVAPGVAAKLDADGAWTNAAEEELLRTKLG